ncbi:MAG: signal peptidase II [Chloroflexi bacterium]|nr:signal peptidase II [Chloroflexota bacterium]
MPTKRLVLFVTVVGVVLLIDQVAKWLVMQNLELGQSWQALPFLQPLFRVTYSYNTGAAFGMFPMASSVFLVLAFIASVVFAVMYFNFGSEVTWLSLVGVPMIVGGALGNAIDRLRFDYVVDFFHVQVANFANISNFADHAITLGVILLFIDQVRIEREEQAQKQEVTTAPVEEHEGIS